VGVVLVALGLIGGIVAFAVRETLDPTVKPYFMKKKLAALAKKKDSELKLDEAEDGIVLARRLNLPALERRFLLVAQALRKKRVMV